LTAAARVPAMSADPDVPRIAMLRRFTPADIRPPAANYSYGCEVPAGARLVFCSGQLGIAPDGAIPEDAGAQTERCFENILAVLRDAGMDAGDIVRINAYVTDRAHLKDYMAARDRHVTDPPPASTLIIVSGFANPAFKVEVEVVAAKVED
jgi:enamine deaminase RidA (YjgF/YER057c/UK114 family)